MALLEADNIHKTYMLPHSTVNVLKGMSLLVDKGESVAIIGVSGAGKTTLLHILGGLDRPDKGRVTVDGRDFYAMANGIRTRIRATRIGFVFQSYHLLPEMDVLENVILPAMAGCSFLSSLSSLKNTGMQLLGQVGLAERANHRPMELSGGEQQRVALARALINDPQLILADEPTGNLDNATGGLVLDSLFTLTKQKERALVLVTHNEKVASSCDRVYKLKEGVLVAV